MDEAGFGQKLDHLKTVFQVTDGEIGGNVGVVASLVCRWRNGERTLDRFDNAHTVKRLAVFFIERAALRHQHPRLAEILSIEETDVDARNEACIDALVDFLYDERSAIPDTGKNPALSNPSVNFIGRQGILDALTALEEQNNNAEITVYLSPEHAHLFQDEVAAGIWALLCRMNHDAPVRVVFDGWTDHAEQAAQNLKALLPYVQTGKIRLSVINAPQKFFYNLTFFAKNAGMVITTEPVGSAGACISLLASAPDYIRGMAAVFADFDHMCTSLARHLDGASTKDEAVYTARLFEPFEDVQVYSGGVNLLYLEEDGYLSLLRQNGITGSQRSYRRQKFVEDKRRFEAFLGKGRLKEIFSLPALDRMIADGKLRTPDFSFHAGEVKADAVVLKNLLTGMLAAIRKYENLTVYLERETSESADFAGQEFTFRIKGDSSVLVYTRESGENLPEGGKTHVVYSEHWRLVYEYIRQFREALQSEQLMNTKHAVETALRLRLERLDPR